MQATCGNMFLQVCKCMIDTGMHLFNVLLVISRLEPHPSPFFSQPLVTWALSREIGQGKEKGFGPTGFLAVQEMLSSEGRNECMCSWPVAVGLASECSFPGVWVQVSFYFLLFENFMHVYTEIWSYTPLFSILPSSFFISPNTAPPNFMSWLLLPLSFPL